MGIVSNPRQNFFNTTVGTNLHVGLNCFQFNGAALGSRGRKCLVDAHQVHKRGMQRAQPVCLRPMCIGHGRPGLIVGKARGRDNDGLVKLIGRNFARRRYHHVTDQHQSLNIRVKRTQAV